MARALGTINAPRRRVNEGRHKSQLDIHLCIHYRWEGTEMRGLGPFLRTDQRVAEGPTNRRRTGRAGPDRNEGAIGLFLRRLV